MRMSSQKSIPTLAVAREPKRRRGQLKVEALLDAASAVFAEKGYAAATMTEIAARAGAAIGSLYQFFPAKEILADALIVRYGTRATEGLRHIETRAPALSPPELADALVDLMLDLTSDRAAAVALV